MSGLESDIFVVFFETLEEGGSIATVRLDFFTFGAGEVADGVD